MKNISTLEFWMEDIDNKLGESLDITKYSKLKKYLDDGEEIDLFYSNNYEFVFDDYEFWAFETTDDPKNLDKHTFDGARFIATANNNKYYLTVEADFNRGNDFAYSKDNGPYTFEELLDFVEAAGKAEELTDEALAKYENESLNEGKKKDKKKKNPYDSYISGMFDPELEAKMFNKMHNTDGYINGTIVPGQLDAAGHAVSGASEGASEAAGGEGGCCEGLTEAKRYVRRYYIRPQEIFCSNKTDIIKALIDIGDENCSVYTLNNLGDIKDVTKLTNDDIIYYYDDGILYDKNKVKVMDYDLYVKHEEERDKLNPDQVSDATFKDHYEDRITDITDPSAIEENFSITESNNTEDWEAYGYVIKYVPEYAKTKKYIIANWDQDYETLSFWMAFDDEDKAVDCCNELPRGKFIFNTNLATWDANTKSFKENINVPENEFDQNFDSINAYGEKVESLTEAKKETHTCCICGEEFEGYGNNPSPVKEKGVCCDSCNMHFVIPARIEAEHEEKNEELKK